MFPANHTAPLPVKDSRQSAADDTSFTFVFPITTENPRLKIKSAPKPNYDEHPGYSCAKLGE